MKNLVNGSYICDSSLTFYDLVDGYEIVNGSCVQKEILRATGLTQNQFDEQSYITGNFIGFVFLLFTTYLVATSQKRN